jgi:hypothetical protein
MIMNVKTTAASGTMGTASAPRRDEAALALRASVTREAHELTDEVKHLAGGVAGEAQKAAGSTVAAGKKRAVEGLGHIAQAIRKTGEQLRAEDQGAFTEYFDGAARRVDVASQYLKNRTLGQLVGDVEQFARNEPALFLGGAFVAGLVGGRFLKSSGPTRSRNTGSGAAHPGAPNQLSGEGSREEPIRRGTPTKAPPANLSSRDSSPKQKEAGDASTKAPGAR